MGDHKVDKLKRGGQLSTISYLTMVGVHSIMPLIHPVTDRCTCTCGSTNKILSIYSRDQDLIAPHQMATVTAIVVSQAQGVHVHLQTR